MVLGPDANFYVADNTLGVLRFDGLNGRFLGVFVPLGNGTLPDAERIVFAPDGALLIASVEANAVLRFDGRSGAFRDVFVSSHAGGLINPRGLAFGPDGHLYIASRDTRQVLRYEGSTGAFLGVAVTAPGSVQLTATTRSETRRR